MSDDIKIVISQKGTIPVYTSTRVGTGDSVVQHDNSMTGAGTLTEPLGLSAQILEKIEQSDKTFVFEFDASQTVWEINHNLNKRPSVTVVDSGGNTLTPTVQYLDNNTVRISFNAPFKGQAYLN